MSVERPPFPGNERFQLLGKLGAGAAGVVYRARDAEMDRDVALKTLPDLGPDQLFYLKQEFRALLDISHPNVVTFHELVADDASAFFTMELIEGVAFDVYVRGGGLGAEGGSAGSAQPWERLARTGQQLMQGLGALHATGRIHRDVKASNVKVTRDGRAVLLDFDLSVPLARVAGRHAEIDEIAGTVAYMAPEIAFGEAVGPAADVYSTGVMFFEALANQLPFTGSVAETLVKRQREQAPSLSSLAPDVPEVMTELVARMLARWPDDRPTVGQTQRALQAMARRRSVARLPTPAATDLPFVGRDRELHRMRDAFESIADGGAVLTHVHGPSGIGKTELVSTFVSQLATEEDVLVLRGRCHPQETVPFKALDGVIDDASRYIRSLPSRERAAFVADASLLRLFPVLGRALGRPPVDDAPMEPHELRRRGVAALRDLFIQLSLRRRLVVWIDDIQWGDLDSLPLLRELWRWPNPPRAMWVATSRREEEAKGGLLAHLSEVSSEFPSEGIVDIALGPLSQADIALLARDFLGGSGPEIEARAADLATESAGSPFLLGALARHMAGEGARGALFAQGVTLAGALDRRLEDLSPVANDILELTAVAGRPILRRVVLNASGAGEGGRPIVASLCQGLLRATQRDEDQWIATYHDRIRIAVLDRLGPEARRMRHRQLAEALSALTIPDPLALVEHLAGSGELRQAGIAALAAADAASETLAFDLAVRLYRLAAEAYGCDPIGWPRTSWMIHAGLAEALLNAGRGGEAGAHFAVAATSLAAHEGEAREVLRLRRRAAEAYLRSGRIEEGRALMDVVLAAVGLAMPETEAGALRTVLWNRARFLFYGTRVKTRPGADAPVDQLDRLDAAWSATTGLSQVDQLRADALGTRHLLEAVALGEPSRIARALAFEATFEATLGGAFFRKRANALVETVYRLAAETGDAYDSAWSRLGGGIVACLCARWRDACGLLDEARDRFRTQCRGVDYEIATAQFFACAAVASRGDLAELRERMGAALSSADDRGDRFAAAQLRLGPQFLLLLVDGFADDIVPELDVTIAPWPLKGGQTQHYLHCLATAQVELYRGDAPAAWKRIETAWGAIEAAGYLRLEVVIGEAFYTRGRVAIAMARAVPSESRRYLAEAERAAARVSGPELPWARPYGAALRSGIARVRGQSDAAERFASEAAAGFGIADMALFAHAHLAASGDIGQLDWFAARGVVEPAKFVAMLAPGFVSA